VLRERIAYDATDMESLSFAFQEAERAQAVLLHDRARCWIGLLDDLGWEDEGTRDSYEITGEIAPVAEWLRAVLDELRALIASTRDTAEIARHEQERETMSRLLEHLSEPAVAVA